MPNEKIRVFILWRFLIVGMIILSVFFLTRPSNFVILIPGPTIKVKLTGQEIKDKYASGRFYYIPVIGEQVNNYFAILYSLTGRDIYPYSNSNVSAGRGEMSSSTATAISLAGAIVYSHTMLSADGVVVIDVKDNSPAMKADIEVGDILYSVDGTTIKSINDLSSILKDSKNSNVKISGRRLDKLLNFTVKPEGSKIGVVLSSDTSRLSKPEIKITDDGVQGGSAGLLYTLSVIDSLSIGDLSNKRKISGTGTISLNGKIGPIEGARYKLASAVRDHMDVFFVPVENYKEVSDFKYGIKIIPVGSIDEALRWLCDNGASDLICEDLR